MDFNDPHCLSTNRCISAANAILEAYYTFSKATANEFSSGYMAYPPIVKLHPFVVVRIRASARSATPMTLY